MNLLYRRSSSKIGRAPQSRYVFRVCVGAAMLGTLFFCVQGGHAARSAKKPKAPLQIAAPGVGPMGGMDEAIAGPGMDNMAEVTRAMPYPPPPLKRRLLDKLRTTLKMKPKEWQEVVPFLGDALDLQFQLNFARSGPRNSPVRKVRLEMWHAIRGDCNKALVGKLVEKLQKAKAEETKKIKKLEKEFASVQKELDRRVREPRQRLVLFLFGFLPQDQILPTKPEK